MYKYPFIVITIFSFILAVIGAFLFTGASIDMIPPFVARRMQLEDYLYIYLPGITVVLITLNILVLGISSIKLFGLASGETPKGVEPFEKPLAWTIFALLILLGIGMLNGLGEIMQIDDLDDALEDLLERDLKYSIDFAIWLMGIALIAFLMFILPLTNLLLVYARGRHYRRYLMEKKSNNIPSHKQSKELNAKCFDEVEKLEYPSRESEELNTNSSDPDKEDVENTMKGVWKTFQR